MTQAFHQSEVLQDLGVAHGFGKVASDGAGPVDLCRVTQVHGNSIVEAPVAGSGAETCADALLTRVSGTALGIQTADCVPILLADQSASVVAAVHAGWRGSAARIAFEAVAELAVDPATLTAVIGPHAGACCYEVDEPVRRAFGAGADAFFVQNRPGHYLLDLFGLNRAQLLEAGVSRRAISRVGGCSICDPHGYPSYRRDPSSGRMVHFIRLP